MPETKSGEISGLDGAQDSIFHHFLFPALELPLALCCFLRPARIDAADFLFSVCREQLIDAVSLGW